MLMEVLAWCFSVDFLLDSLALQSGRAADVLCQEQSLQPHQKERLADNPQVALLLLTSFPPFGRTLTTSAWARKPSAWPIWLFQAQRVLPPSINPTSTTPTAAATPTTAATPTAALPQCPTAKESTPGRCWWTRPWMNFQKEWIPLKKRWQHCRFDVFVAQPGT